MKIYSIFCLLFLTLSGGVFAQPQNNSALAAVVEAEKAFAAAAAERGTNAAFVQFATADALIFDRKPENVRELYRKLPPSQALLSWKPTFYGVSSSGDIGFTTGPWEYRPKGKTDQPTAWGEFATVWKKQPDGTWKFILDTGIEHAKPEGEQPIEQQFVSTTGKPEDYENRDYWRELENVYLISLGKDGVKKTYEKLASENMRLLRQNHFPFAGRKAALEFLAVEKNALSVKPLGGEISSDLAYSYGEYNLTDAGGKIEKGFYIRVWKREAKGWRIALDTARPIPPAGK